MTKIDRTFKLQRDKPDRRDYLYSARTARQRMIVPTSVDLRPRLNPVYDQGQLGSCTSQAICGHIYHNKRVETSRLFVYYNERLLEGTVNQDAGAMIRDGIKSLTIWGTPKESIWPYNIAAFRTRPSPNAYLRGKQFLLRSYHRIITLDDMINCLAEGYPFVTGLAIFTSFETQETATTGIVPLPTAGEQLLGGHAVLVVGYDLNARTFICRNSWGVNWGQAGYFTIPFLYFTNFGLAWDMWTIRS